MKIVAKTQNRLSNHEESTQMFIGESSQSNICSVECHSATWRFELRSSNLP